MKVLAIGCHPDDIEVACAGTLLGLNIEVKSIKEYILEKHYLKRHGKDA